MFDQNSDLRYMLHEEWMKDMRAGSDRERLAAQRQRRPFTCRICLALAQTFINAGQRLQQLGMQLGQNALGHQM